MIGFILMNVIMKHSQSTLSCCQEWLGKLNGHIEETYSGHNVIRAYNSEAEVTRTFDEMNEKLYESNWKSQFLSGLMMPIMSFVGNLGYVAVCVAGALLALNNHISFGVIVAFMVYVRLFTIPSLRLPRHDQPAIRRCRRAARIQLLAGRGAAR